MFYITKEYCSEGGGIGIGYRGWYEYTLQTTKPNSKEYYVKVNLTKEGLKKLVITYDGSLNKTLKYLFDVTQSNKEIDNCFEG